MRSFRLWGAVALTSALAFAVATVGCGGSATKSDGGGEQPKAGGEQPKGKGELKPIEAKGMATLKGRVMFNGTPPADKPETFSKNPEVCEKGNEDEKVKQDWRVSKDGGVANVVVWLRAPAGQFFDVPEAQRKPAVDMVKLDQPHCAFVPHVVVLFPSYFDPTTKKQKETGQKFEAVNSAMIDHNTKWDPKNSVLNRGDNVLIAKEGEDFVRFKCEIHPWMSAYAWVLDHPYAAVTDKEGNYEIKNAPAGAELNVVYWHESFDTPKAEKKTLKEGENDFNPKVGP